MQIRDVPTGAVLPEGSAATKIEEGEIKQMPFGVAGAVGDETIIHPYFGGFDKA
jgi:hypothetical protein